MNLLARLTRRTLLFIAATLFLAVAIAGSWLRYDTSQREERVLSRAAAAAKLTPEANAKEACAQTIEPLNKVLDNMSADEDRSREALGGYQSLAQCLGHLGKLPEAAAAYGKAIAINAEIGHLHGDVAVIYSRMKQHLPAERSARLAVQLDPLIWQAHRQLARVLAAAGKIRAADASYEEALKLAPREQLVKLQEEINQFRSSAEQGALATGDTR